MFVDLFSYFSDQISNEVLKSIMTEITRWIHNDSIPERQWLAGLLFQFDVSYCLNRERR